MNNMEKLKQLLTDVFLLEPEEFSFDLKRSDIDSWDSLGTVAMAVGVQESFGHHMKPEEAVAIASVQDIVRYLEAKGVSFNE
ncbi:Acyl carrier protein [uncultured archaeon]|nr:Acyl carrier protein [uncultured archaeon]